MIDNKMFCIFTSKNAGVQKTKNTMMIHKTTVAIEYVKHFTSKLKVITRSLSIMMPLFCENFTKDRTRVNHDTYVVDCMSRLTHLSS